MTAKQLRTRGFSLTELVVCTAIAGMAFVFGAPALDKGREGADRKRCENNLRQLSQAHLMFANAHGGLPPMAMSFSNATQGIQPGPGGWHDGHGWYSYIGPFIGEPEWAASINMNVSLSHSINAAMRRGGLRLKVYACPADIGLQRSEWSSSSWARVLANYVVNAGNTNYGQQTLNGVPFLGAPFTAEIVTPLATITDGLSDTLMMSEVPVLRGCTGWGGMYSDTQSSLGGQIFTGYRAPNPNTPDGIGAGRNGNGDCGSVIVMDQRYTAAGVLPVPNSVGGGAYATYIAARSRHPGGVNASLCDGSAGFVADTIDPAVWRALSSARGADFVPPTQSPTSNAGKKGTR
jgi:prepilin-type N-terminal cleavage/methylation domain-containing protein/prepilin-type processing-associated H-X9-DG protein